MNIFVLDLDFDKNAEYHTNSHIVKMIVESAQILSTVCRMSGIESGYKVTHKNHPCTKWARESFSNWMWLRNLVYALNKEYRYRYDKSFANHKSFDVAIKLSYPDIEDKGLTPFALAMPEQYQNPSDPVSSYRNYYINEKRHLFHWKKREVPSWILE